MSSQGAGVSCHNTPKKKIDEGRQIRGQVQGSEEGRELGRGAAAGHSRTVGAGVGVGGGRRRVWLVAGYWPFQVFDEARALSGLSAA